MTEKERIIYSLFDRENILVGREMLLEGVFQVMRAKQPHWTQVTLVEKNPVSSDELLNLFLNIRKNNFW